MHGSGNRQPEPEDWIAPQWILDHLGPLAIQASYGYAHPGGLVAVPFPDLHSMHLEGLLSTLPVDAHNYGARAFGMGTGFAMLRAVRAWRNAHTTLPATP